MQPSLEALMTGASGLWCSAMALGANVATWRRASNRAGGRLARASQRRVGPYLLLDKIAAGAMGEVYRARHCRSGQVRALKLLDASADERRRLQFEKEARVGEQLDHPNAVVVLGHGEAPDGTRYLAMELLDGVTLEALVEREGAQSPRRVVELLRQLAAVLAELHERGLVHRDIKPSNILVSRGPDGSDRVKLLDFGLIKDLSEAATSAERESAVGTPLYISPEALATPDAVDGRADLYGLGGVAYFLLTGAPVFAGQGTVELCAQHLLTPPRPLRGVAPVSSELERVVLDCLAKEPAARPASARALCRRLRRCPEAQGPAGALPQRAPVRLADACFGAVG
ncbi:MAG TPA: serine/threonine-protein kinase [Polyangiaceae bacterium]|jgi:serine/threonine-protein kinase|nr:serine/threonine-protein kinase [Polyangiaceae bacterium]